MDKNVEEANKEVNEEMLKKALNKISGCLKFG